MMLIRIDRESTVPMIRQLYGRIRETILSGRLQPGARLPSSRELAVRLQVSRNVVLEAYDLLYAEGFLAPKQGAGTYVARGAKSCAGRSAITWLLSGR
jgi:GntR family transcriptional regulator/MocR family aminotransferase